MPQNNKIEVLEYTLPDYTASYLINADCSGLTDEEIKEIDDFTAELAKDNISIVGMNEDSSFKWRNDLNNLGADCSTFIAHKLNS